MRRPSFPTVILRIALFVAVGGTSYAVIKLPSNSVGGREIKPDSVTGGDIRNGSVASGGVMWVDGGTAEGDRTSLDTISFWTD